MGSGPQTDKTPAAKSLYRLIFFDDDIWHYFYQPNLSTVCTILLEDEYFKMSNFFHLFYYTICLTISPTSLTYHLFLYHTFAA
jgi:hypothetical protein